MPLLLGSLTRTYAGVRSSWQQPGRFGKRETNGRKEKATRPVKWQFPEQGFIKINTDRAALGNPGRAGFGGLIRESSSNWIKGYYGFIGHSTSLMAELRGIREGMKLAATIGFDKVIVESDCDVAIKLLSYPNTKVNHFKEIIEDCEEYEGTFQVCMFNHVFREANACADFLASVGVNQEEKLVIKERSIPG
ncbi:hypothetical protein F0562_002940 [Nyssa sinensis]|uniref:RNase H type-1 domain-containing protein n=1 Tax=Nyssa sinensis TaxID=561372 RepID=A0A5J5BXG5_9ASTE|nr:hypothetical protein F0562_002940 [Nyssa sinensis]